MYLCIKGSVSPVKRPPQSFFAVASAMGALERLSVVESADRDQRERVEPAELRAAVGALPGLKAAVLALDMSHSPCPPPR